MCYHKSLIKKYEELMSHYSASFHSITEELNQVKERFTILARKDEFLHAHSLDQSELIGEQLIKYSAKNSLPSFYTKEELSELKWSLKLLTGFDANQHKRFYENGFDFLPTPIITAGSPEEFKLFKWGFVPSFMKTKEEAYKLRINTLNCISDEMYEKRSYLLAAKNAQRCLIPITGFFEWRWLDEEGTVKIPYHVTFADQGIRSMAGLYSRWKDPLTGEYYYSYTLCTTRANVLMDYVHNKRQRMPVFLHKDNEKDWLNKDLSKDDVLDLCQPFDDTSMRAYTISKLLTARNVNTNVPHVLERMNYNPAIEEANQFLLSGDKKKALQIFKENINPSLTISDVVKVGDQQVTSELSMASY